MNPTIWISQTILFVKKELQRAEGGHDWWHIERVWIIARKIAATEEANLLIVELGALLHDIADSKFHQGDETLGPQKARQFLQSIHVDEDIIFQVEQIIRNISFKGGNFEIGFNSSELNIVQDADRLDAMGAIGIARTFHYGGFKNREIYNPDIQPQLHQNREQYKASTAPTINHFYEKLLQLRDRMNTQTGKRMAEQRHQFMEEYLEQFFSEIEGNR